MSDVVAQARQSIKDKKKYEYDLEHGVEQFPEEHIDEDFTYSVCIDIKVKKNGKPVAMKPNILNWAGNILMGCSSHTKS